MVVDIGGVTQDVSELLRAVYTKPYGICYSFAAVFMGVGLRDVRWGISDFLQIALQSRGVLVLTPCLI